MTEKKKKIVSYIIAYAIALVVAFLSYYIILPPINGHSVGFWFFLTWLILLAIAPYYALTGGLAKLIKTLDQYANKTYIPKRIKKSMKEKSELVGKTKRPFPFYVIALVPIAILIIGGISSTKMFNASTYANVITVTEAEFETDMPKTDKVTHIALMDTATAEIIGNRTLGSLSNVVSQYEVSGSYNQINFQNTPQKVANLEYAGFFKWLGNNESGIPGYVMVDPVDNTAKYVELSTPLKYVDSAYFGEDLSRKLRFSYPTKVFGEPRYEIDDSGNPVFIVPCLKPHVSLFGAMDVNEVVLFNPCTGESELLSSSECPSWVDEVYDGYLACEKYDWKGLLSGGFINSIIGNKDCKQTTDDFGYVILNDDVWYYTGVTSVNSDKSNIGFIMTNARTGEYKFYPVIGAEEHSAMAAAEGEVQEKEYVASFPALINVSGQATYIMVLKDAAGLVKLYALVNVETYSIVATGTTQEKAMEAYNELLVENGIITEEIEPEPEVVPDTEAEIIVSDIRIATSNGESVAYINATYNGQICVFRKKISSDESLMLISVGDKLNIKAAKTETDRVYSISSWSFVTEP